MDLKRKANSLSRDTRQANALGLEGGPPPLGNCSTRHDLIVGGLYPVTVLRENDQERVTVYSKHRLKQHAQTTLTNDGGLWGWMSRFLGTVS